MNENDVQFEHYGAVGLITLNRPKALNALTHEMCLAMKAQLDAWANDPWVETVVIRGQGERAFCAGGDVRSLYESGKKGTPYALEFYRDEYLLNATIKRFPKPYIALLSGITMGGGVGVSIHGSQRVADESMTFAMPETGIGLFPDVGASFFLPRCPGQIGMYLALTGARLNAADAVYAGLATHFVPAAKRGELLASLANGDNPDAALQSVSVPLPAAPLAAHRASIDRIFVAESVEAILSILEAERTDWATETAKSIRSKSPTATKLAFQQIRKGKLAGFTDCMRMEFRMVNRVMSGHDFYEGVRATIIDKDGAPRWKPNSLTAVGDAEIGAYFAPLGNKELPL